METTIIKFAITVLVSEDTVGYHAFIPAFKGLHSYGDSPEEAADNAAQAAVAYIKSMIKHGEPIPIPYIVEDDKELKDKFTFDVAYTKEILVS